MKKSKVMIFNDQNSYDHELYENLWSPTGVSMTVPDDALSISEILDRFSHGIAPNIMGEPEYEDGIDIDDEVDPMYVPGVDISELHEINQETGKKFKKHFEEKKAVQDKLDLEANEAAIIERHEKKRAGTTKTPDINNEPGRSEADDV
jgi:hypothetical protein